jgi:hypothetical protein
MAADQLECAERPEQHDRLARALPKLRATADFNAVDVFRLCPAQHEDAAGADGQFAGGERHR